MNFKPQNYLSEADLINLDLYEYHGGEYSYIDNLLNPMWVKVAYMFPHLVCSKPDYIKWIDN